MAGLFSRLKVWMAKEVLTYSDLNQEFDNVIANSDAEHIGGYSETTTDMRAQTNPGSVGSESLATSVAGELERLRYAIARITGKTYWYEAPNRSLQSIYSNARHIFSPPVDYDSNVSGGGIGEVISAGIYDSLGFSDLDFKSSTNTKFSAYSLQNPTTSPRYFYLDPGRLAGASNSYAFWFRNFAAGDTILFNPVLGLRVYLNLSGYIQADLTLRTTTGSNKDVQSIVGTTSLAGGTNFNHLLLTYKVSGSAGDSMSLYINGTLIGSISTALAANVPHRNERMFLMGSNASRTSIKNYNANVIPDSDGWTLTQSGGSSSVSGGILNLSTTTGTNRYYTYTDSARSSPVWFECKFRLPKPSSVSGFGASISSYLDFFARTSLDSGGKATHVSVNMNTLSVGKNLGVDFTTTTLRQVPHNFAEWTVLTVQQTATLTSIYINGVLKMVVDTQADATAGTAVGFGKFAANAPGISGIEIEYFKYGSGSGVISPNTVNTQQISDFVSFKGLLTDSTVISSLQTSSPFSIYGVESNTKNTEVYSFSTEFDGGQVTVPVSTYLDLNGSGGSLKALKFFSDGKTPITFSAQINGRTITTGATTFVACAAYLRIESSSYFSVLAGQSARASDVSLLPGSVPKATLYVQNITAGTMFPINFSLFHSQVLPPGEHSVSIVAYTSAGSTVPTYNAFTITVTQ